MPLPKGQGRPGRGCCARCMSPWMCANPECGCHVPVGAVCTFCHVGLFIAIPSDSDLEVAVVRAALLAGYGFERGAA